MRMHRAIAETETERREKSVIEALYGTFCPWSPKKNKGSIGFRDT